MTKKVIFITGGSGFVGANLSIYFKERYPNYDVVVFDNLRRRGSELNLNRLKERGVTFIHGDVRNEEDFLIDVKPDVMIDASADPSVLAGIQTPVRPLINTNLVGTVNALEYAIKHKADFIFLSTSRVYPIQALSLAKYQELETRFQWSDEQAMKGISSKGITESFSLEGYRSFYGATKLASELLIEEYASNFGAKTVINRCGVISGPWQMGKIDQGVLALWIARHYFKKKLSYIGFGGTGKQTRDVLHIRDLFELIDDQVHNISAYNGKTFNVGGGFSNSFSLLELTKLCQKVVGNEIDITSVEKNRDADIPIYITDNTMISKVHHWEPSKSLEDIVYETFQWLKENETELKNIIT